MATLPSAPIDQFEEYTAPKADDFLAIVEKATGKTKKIKAQYFGQTAPSTNYKWVSGFDYPVDAIVDYNGQWYLSLQTPNLGKIPNSQPLYWELQSKSPTSSLAFWEAGVFTGDPVLVLYEISAGVVELYRLINATRPFLSANFVTELGLGDWEIVSAGQTHFKGVFASEAALNIAYPTAEPGDNAYVDVGSSDAALYLWDDTDSIWVASGITTVVPPADSSTPGIAKLFTDPDGTDTDGAVSRAGLNTKFRKTRTVTGVDSIIQGDDNSLIIFNSATPFNFTLDQLTTSSKVSFLNIGAGAVTFINGTGVTLVGSAILPGAVGTDYPSSLVFYISATSPRIVSGKNKIDLSVPSTAGGTITLDVNGQVERVFVGSASFSSAKTIALSNDTNALVIDMIFNITNVAGTLDFPSTFTMQTSDARWTDASHRFTPSTTGKHEFSAVFDGTDWNMKATNPYA